MGEEHPSYQVAKGALNDEPKAGLVPPLLTEALGAFAITFVDAGGAMIASLYGADTVSHAARAASAGLTVLAFSYALGDVSGAHFNPAVTFAFALRRVFPWRRVPLYWTAQLVGAVAAAALLRATLGNVAHVGANVAQSGAGAALTMETVLTFFLVTIILCTSLRSKVLGPHAALAAGATVAFANLFAKPVSGVSMNPARSFGSAVIGGALPDVWLYVMGPLVGASIAVAFMGVVHRHRHAAERAAARGERQARDPDG